MYGKLLFGLAEALLLHRRGEGKQLLASSVHHAKGLTLDLRTEEKTL